MLVDQIQKATNLSAGTYKVIIAQKYNWGQLHTRVNATKIYSNAQSTKNKGEVSYETQRKQNGQATT